MNIKRRLMNTRSLMRGDLQRYSLKDIEYGIKIVQGEIDDINHTLKVLTKLQNSGVIKGSYPQLTLEKALNAEVERLEKVIGLAESEIVDRLLTENK